MMPGENRTKILREAEKHVLQGRIPLAIAEYLKIIKSDPNDVFILNTVGDLYLRLGKVLDASKYFSQVAEHYVRNNFLLKAIAVYRKLLNADLHNVDVNRTLASLYARLGLNVEARNQYLRVAELCAKEGKTRESVEAYEKVAEMDSSNSAVQTKLAEIYLAEGSKEKAHYYFAAAGRAQSKSGDPVALISFGRAMQLNPVDKEVMKSFLDASIQLGDVVPALEQLKKSLVMVPGDPAFQEMLGRAYIAAKDPENAAKCLAALISEDESRYAHMLSVSKIFASLGDYDRAATCLDVIVPILIGRRETDRAVEAYNTILKTNPDHVLALMRLAEVYSATNEEQRYIDILDKISGYYLSRQSPKEALEYVEKALLIRPTSEKHLRAHREMFEEAFPGTPYIPPVVPVEPKREPVLAAVAVGQAKSLGETGEDTSNPGLVEIDLLLNYGMTEKALERLLDLEAQDHSDKDVSLRLLSLYKEGMQPAKAAEQALMLAAQYRATNNEEAAQKYLNEAKKLNPDLVGPQFDLDAFAIEKGLLVTSGLHKKEAVVPEAAAGIEVDLSGDLSEIFFKDTGGPIAEEETELEPAGAEPFSLDRCPSEPTPRPPAFAIQDQLQEVDFYIRLEFFDEARAKLDELAKDHPNNPELALRYRQLSERGAAPPIIMAPGERRPDAPAEATPPDEGDIFQELKFDQTAGRFADVPSSSLVPEPQVPSEDEVGPVPASGLAAAAELGKEQRRPQLESASKASPSGPVNTMFADLLEEVNALSDQEMAREDFETHFSLGIVYREMELREDAIREFQAAIKALDPAKFPKEVIRCCGMLSACFLGKGMPRSAIRWCQTGLNVPTISPHEAMALRYDMGVAHSLAGEPDRALECFDCIFGKDPSYRDVAQRIDEIKRGPDRHVP